MSAETPKRKASFGGCGIARVSPASQDLPEVLNVTVAFEDALRFKLALDAALLKLNGYDRSTTGGKRAALNIVLHLWNSRIAVMETTLPREPDEDGET